MIQLGRSCRIKRAFGWLFRQFDDPTDFGAVRLVGRGHFDQVGDIAIAEQLQTIEILQHLDHALAEGPQFFSILMEFFHSPLFELRGVHLGREDV